MDWKRDSLESTTWTVTFRSFAEIIGFLDKKLRSKGWNKKEMKTIHRDIYSDKQKDTHGRYELRFEQVLDKNGQWVPKYGTVKKSVCMWNKKQGRIPLEHCFFKNGKPKNALFVSLYGNDIKQWVGRQYVGKPTE